ncbi:MAG TPA: hypothetical protein EYP40_11315, partial [Chromatiales bacterium]|nr:hypothetical protein [Chromatiales bacterium]
MGRCRSLRPGRSIPARQGQTLYKGSPLNLPLLVNHPKETNMRFMPRGILVASLLALALPVAVTAADKAVAIVNGKPISQKTYELYLKQREAEMPANANLAGNRNTIINELVNRELLYQDALDKKLDKDPDVAFATDQMTRNLLIQADVSRMARENKISDAKLKQIYQQQLAKMDMTEYKASHILLKTEDDARAVIKELDKGARFSDLAKSKSTGPTGPNGGSLGWFKAGQMAAPFSKAVSEMKKGSYSKKPVQTQFGWHVILLEDTRQATPPKFEDVKNQLLTYERTRQLQAYLEKLRNKAKI